MTRTFSSWSGLLVFCVVCAFPARAAGQIVETVGSRALGMGGAFVAVADDSSATWWNPAGLAAGPFFDMALARAATGVEEGLPARRDRATWFALGTPPFGFSYYAFRVTEAAPPDPTAAGVPDREDERAGVPVRSLSASQLGVTLVQTLLPGIHAGTTVKYVRGTLHASREDPSLGADDLLERGEALEGGEAQGKFGIDLGAIAAGGPLRAGLLVRNVSRPELGGVRLPRQVRVGAAFDGDRAGAGPFLIALDADVVRYESGTGDRRVVALGAEHWFADHRLGVRAGARFNTVGAKDRSASAGISVAVRAALYVDAHVVGGGDDDERGWGLAARVSF